MDISHKDMMEILEIIEKVDIDYFELEAGGFRILLDRNDSRRVETRSSNGPVASDPLPEIGRAPEPAQVPDAAASGPPPASTGSEEGLVAVRSPMIGVFYAAPRPDAPPYVQVGDRVTADMTIAIIEVMKVFNSVNAGVDGTVERILVANEDFVEVDDILILIRPDA